MKARIDNPALTVPGVLDALHAIGNSLLQSNLAETTLFLVELRASQINSCAVCIDMHSHALMLAGEPTERINAVAAWRETPYFTDPERAALALTEAATRLADRPDPVPSEVWDEAARHFDEAQLAALVVAIASINAWNRINSTTGQITGKWAREWVERAMRPRQAP